MKKRFRGLALTLGAVVLLSSAGTALATEVDAEMLQQLQALIKQQQSQLDKQAMELKALQEKVGGVSVAVEQKADKSELVAVSEEAKKSSGLSSRFDNVDLSFYGFLNKAYMWADNGDASKSYFVDNDNAMSRVGLNIGVHVSDNFTVGGKLEYGLRSNPSSKVNQFETDGFEDILLRHADIFFADKRYGKFSLGKGSMAADGSSEMDLSGTSIVTYASVQDMAGGQLWSDGSGLHENSTYTYPSGDTEKRTRNNLKVGDVFTDMDGGRENRARYDTPTFYGFMASTSVAADDNYDLTLRYSQEYPEIAKVAAAMAYQSPGDEKGDIFNGSISVLFPVGISATIAGGTQDSEEAGIDDATFWYGKIGYQSDICSLGKTAFSIDYGQNNDVYATYDSDGDGVSDANTKGAEAKTWSVAAVQHVDDWGTEFYLAFRQYKYEDDTNIDFDDVNVVMSGARIQF